MISECEELFIDGTFKMAPKNFYQILNIWGFLISKQLYLPLVHILMTSKNQICYKHVFLKLKQLLVDNNLDTDFKEKIIVTDYEKSLRSAIEEILNPKELRGCFFHFSKALWKKSREYGLTKKQFRKDGMLITFCFKMYPFIHNDNRVDYLDKLKTYIEKKDKRFMKYNKI